MLSLIDARNVCIVMDILIISSIFNNC